MSRKDKSMYDSLLSKLLLLAIILFFAFPGCNEVDTLHQDSIQENDSGNYEEAIKLLKKILTIDKENPRYLNNLGWTLFRNDNFDEAMVTLQKAKTTCKSKTLMKAIETNLFMVSTFQKGKELIQEKKYDEAVTEFEKVTSKYNTKELELKYLALCYEGMGKYDEANERWEKIVEMYEGTETPNKFYLLATEKLSMKEKSSDPE
ncbi:MAG: tetratricopeptide repeat protein [Candidatus Aminicenantes bacterium]|nr:tetratricopeptide repeat protein [Candidatus Aminicenantes bacterium]NIM83576.1 tetratricopeptide repeat protein [Candidatus Aminicenantes bacterium]NIN22977.1 tetratricopeptide repeat protein [Candidatus Aminicenantes bacterium]NIN46714.1 tetratricopeptide repeat protein [Candidatus Aminicenantes bacterium]NIN89620.1 tetratricopeptide repeat protein [Candidatus Aminicenantes bacterium]